jgi:hypothetical protein
MLEREASLLLRGEDKGLNQLLSSVTKSSINLNKEVAQAGSSFIDLGNNIPHKSLDLFGKSTKGTLGGLKGLNSSLGGVSTGYGNLINKTEQASKVLEGTDNLFVKLGANALGYGKTLDGISSGLGPAANFWQQYSAASSGAGKSLLVLKTAGQGLNPVLHTGSDLALAGADSLKSMGGAASELASPLEKLAGTLSGAQKGFKVAAIASNVSQVVDKVKEFTGETLPELQEGLQDTLETVDQLGVKEKFFGSTFKTINTTATVLSATTKGLSKHAADAFLSFAKFLEVKGYLAIVTTSLLEVSRTLDSSYQAIEDFKALGIDTTIQETALSIGVIGENLILSTEAAKKFRTEAISSFVQLQDSLAYLTTLSTAAAEGQDKLGESILNLVDGPLKNSISALDAASGYYDAISSGQSSVDFLNASLKFSAATGATATDSIGALAQVHNIYQINARDATKTAALFNSTIENGVINGAQMASGIGQLASVAKSAGIDIVELNAMLAALTKNGFSATDAFQGLMSLITSIAGQGSQSAQAAQELGIRFDFARIKAEGLMKPINELYAVSGGSDTKIKTIVPDALAYRTAISLATGASKDFVAIQEQMNQINPNSLDVVFERRRDSVLQRTKELQNGFANEMTRFGQQLQGTLEPAIAVSEALLERFRSIPEPMRNLILMATKTGLVLDKLQQSTGILLNTTLSLGKAYALFRVASLIPIGAGKQRLANMIDLIKNQKDYTKALQVFLGVSDSVGEKIKHLTGIEKSQYLTNQKLLTSRQKAVTELSKGDVIGGVNLFASSEKQVKQSINKSFANATPLVKARADELRSKIFGQFDDLKDGSKKKNLIFRELGLDRIKDTEKDLAEALERIRAKKEAGFTDRPRKDRAGYIERLDLVEDNIQKRQELLGLSRQQLALEQQGVESLSLQMNAATTSVKGTIGQSKELIGSAIAAKGELLAEVRQATSAQLSLIDADIKNQVSNLSPRFASILAQKTGAELDAALQTIGSNGDEQTQRLAETLAGRKEIVEASKAEIDTIRDEGKALVLANSGRKLDSIERDKAREAIGREIAIREKNINLLQENNKIDFLQIIGDEDIKEKIQAGFTTATKEVQDQMQGLAKELQSSSKAIFESDEATGIADAIGLVDVQNNLSALDEVTTKLEELKQAGHPDPDAIALVEENLNQRRELGVVTAGETAALRVQTASLAQQNAVLGLNNLERAQAIGFTGPLAVLNTKLAASYFAVTEAMTASTVAGGVNTIGMKAGAIATKAMEIAKLGWAGATRIATGALSGLWVALGPIGVGIAALAAGLFALSKIRGHIKMLEETRASTDKLLNASKTFTQQLSIAKDLRSLATELGQYSQEIKQTEVFAKKTGVGIKEAADKVEGLSDLNVETLTKTTDKFDSISKVSLDSYVQQLEKTGDALLDYNAASNKAFDSVTVAQTIAQSKAVAAELKKLADNARLAGDNLEAIRLDNLVKKVEAVASNGDVLQRKFESSFSRKELDEYKKRTAELEKERAKLDQKAYAKRGQLDASNREKYVNQRREASLGPVDEKKLQAEVDALLAKDAAKNDINQQIAQVSKKAKSDALEIQGQIAKAQEGTLLGAAFKPDPADVKRKKAELDYLKNQEKAKKDLIYKSKTELAAIDAQGVNTLSPDQQQQRNDLIEKEKTQSKELLETQKDRAFTQNQYDNQLRDSQALSPGEEILKQAQANVQGAALTASAFKELQQVEKDAVDQATALTDQQTKDLEDNLALHEKNGTKSAAEIAQSKQEIQALKDLNSARQEEFKAQEQRLKESQAALVAIDLNNAALTTGDLGLQRDRARARVVQDTVDDTTKATQKYQDFMKAVELDAHKIAELPEEYRTASLATFDAMSDSMLNGANINSTYQRRYVGIALNGLAEVATNADITTEKGLESSRTAVDKAIENVQILQSSGVISPEAVAQMYTQIEQISSKIGLVGKEGSILAAEQIDAIFNGRLAAEQEYVDRLVAINQQAIDKVAHLESAAVLSDFEAQEQKLALEVTNNDLIYRSARSRYDKLAAERGLDTKESLEAYGQMLAAERSLEVSQFQQKRAAETRALQIATAQLNLEVDRTIFNYNQEIDQLQLITSELERQERIIGAYNEGLNTSLSFLDELTKSIGEGIKNERVQAGFREGNAERNLAILKLQQKQERESIKRQMDRNHLKGLEEETNINIAIAEKDRDIQTAQAEFEQEGRNRKLRDDEKAAFALRLEQMQRERSLLNVRQQTLYDDYVAEVNITKESARQLELKQEQARNSGVLDIISSKLDQITAKYKEQEVVNSAINESFDSRVGYAQSILNSVATLTTNEKEQQRLAQIAAVTKLQILERQQQIERDTLALQQAQQTALIGQEKIKLRILALQEQSAIADTKVKLAEAKQSGNKDLIKSLEGVLNSRAEFLGTLELSAQSLDQQLKTQGQLNRLERENLGFKQKGDRFAAKTEVNRTRPEGQARDNEARRLQREGLRELGLNTSNLRSNSFNVRGARIPAGSRINSTASLDVDGITQAIENQVGEGLDLKLGKSEALEQQFAKVRDQVFSNKPKTLVDYVDPAQANRFKQDFAQSLGLTSAPKLPAVTDVKLNTTPTSLPLGVGNSLNNSLTGSLNSADNASLLATIKEQLEVQKELVAKFKANTSDMYNDININVADASVGANEIGDIFLNKFDQILTQAEKLG